MGRKTDPQTPATPLDDEPSHRKLLISSIIGTALSAVGLYAIPPALYKTLRDEFYIPLVEGHPVIIVSWGAFALPGAVIANVLMLLISILVSLKLLSFRIPDVEKPFIWAGIISIILMAPVAKGGMWAASYHVTQNMGYEYCSALSQYGVGVVDRAYVKHRAFCYKPPRR